MSSKFCGPDIIKFFTVQPPPEKFPIILSGSSGCVIDNITVDVDGAFELPDTTVTDNFGNSFTIPAVTDIVLIGTVPISGASISSNPCIFRIFLQDVFPIDLVSRLGCLIDTIETNPNGSFGLPATTINDDDGNFDTAFLGNTINIVNGTIGSITTTNRGCDTNIILGPCPNPFPIILSGSNGCVIDTITTNPNGAFELPNITVVDGDSFSVSTSSPNNIIVSGVSISSINSDGCDLTINITSSGPTNIIPNRVIPDFSSVIDFTGDLAWQWDNDTYNYNDGSGIVQELDPTAGTEYWFRLKYNNQFGNGFRFTDDKGVSAPLGRYDFQGTTIVPNSPGATPGYFIDHLTGLGWTTFAVAGTKNYTDSLALCASVSIGIYNDFRMPALVEFRSLAFIDSLIYVANTGTNPFARGGISSFDPTGTGNVIILWYNRAHGSATRGGTISNFRLRSSDALLTSTAGNGTYGVRKHF